MNALAFVLGVAIVLATAADIFQSVIVPRPAGRRLRASVTIGRSAWAAWRFVAARLGDGARARWLGAYAPILLVTFLGFWVVSLVVGYGLVFYALRSGVKPVPGFLEAMYFSGTTALTVGYGDFVPISAASRIVALFAGASGLAGIAVGTSFLFPIFGAYQSREVFVILVGNRAGRSPSAVQLLVRDRTASNSMLAADLRDAEVWLAQLLKTHLAYPILTWFRSTDENISWIAVVETFLDATSLLLAAVDESALAEAQLVQTLGARFVDDFSKYIHLPEGDTTLDAGAFDRAYGRLRSAGYEMRDRESARDAFVRMRARYAGRLDAISRYWCIPRARLFGDCDDA